MNRRTFVMAGLSASLSACAYKASPFSTYSPLLFEVRPPEGRVASRDDTGAPNASGRAFLFGAVHLGLSRFYPLPDPVEKAWERSDSLAVELDIVTRHASLRAAYGQRVLLPGGETLDDLLSSDEVRRIRNLMHFDHQDWQGLRRLQPWALTLNLFNDLENQGAPRSDLGLDMFFLRRARDRRRPVLELEAPEDQIEAFAGGSREEQLEQLRNRVRQLQRHERTTELIIEAWRRGDGLALEQLKRDSFGDEHRLSSLHRRVNVARDRKMAAALAQHLEEGRQIFAVVGAFHLVGPDCLVERLRKDHGLDVTLSTG